MTLLDAPHHDGSARYVPERHPRLGQTIRVRVRVPHASGFTRVHVRHVADAEARYVAAEMSRRDEVDTWWEAALPLVNPVTTYRFVLEGGPLGLGWLNGAGLWRRDVPDAADFRIVADAAPPDWVTDAVVYQIFPDRFASTGPKDAPAWAHPAAWTDPVDLRHEHGYTSGQLYGGDLDGIVAHLGHIAALGANVLYLTPFFPAGSTHRYDASTFEAVDPLLGGDAALARLIEAAHARGIRVMGDLTTNHTGVTHEWFVAASASPQAPEHDHYLWRADGSPVTWYDVPSLPKLDWDSPGVAEKLCGPDGVLRRWVRFGLDGWRVDVANMTGRHGAQDRNHEVARWVRQAVAAERSEALVVAEHTHDYTTDLIGDGWHGVMNYAGFMKPVWTWLRQHGRDGGFLGAPVVVPELGGDLVMDTIRDFTARVPWSVLVASWNLVGSHDATRVRTLVGPDAARVLPAAALLLTMPSTPMLTYGDEIGMEGAYGEDGRRPMPWDAAGRGADAGWDETLLAMYSGLIAARRGSSALREGGLRWVDAGPEHLTYLREAVGETALVHVARGRHQPVRLPVDRLPGVAGGSALFGVPPEFGDDGTLTVAAEGPAATIWSWRHPA